MNVLQLKRAELFAEFTDKPILFIPDMFGDGVNYWFVCYAFREFNPSNHIHFNEMERGICINDQINSQIEFDKQMFNTKLQESRPSSMIFSNLIKWIRIK